MANFKLSSVDLINMASPSLLLKSPPKNVDVGTSPEWMSVVLTQNYVIMMIRWARCSTHRDRITKSALNTLW